MGSGGVDEVPAVDEGRPREIELVDPALLALVARAECLDHQQQCQEPCFVNRGMQQCIDVSKRRPPVSPYETSNLRDSEYNEPIALTVLARIHPKEYMNNDGTLWFIL